MQRLALASGQGRSLETAEAANGEFQRVEATPDVVENLADDRHLYPGK
jgi:hypothetical protein